MSATLVRRIALTTAVLAATAAPAHAQNAWFFNLTPQAGAVGATGSGRATLSITGTTMTFSTFWSGLSGVTTVAHVHCCTATPGVLPAPPATPVPSFPGFPTGLTAGTFNIVLDLSQASSWNPAFITNNGGTTATAQAAFIAGLNSGRAYFNVHSSTFSGGEINGFSQIVPEPSTYALLATGLAGLAAIRRRRRA